MNKNRDEKYEEFLSELRQVLEKYADKLFYGEVCNALIQEAKINICIWSEQSWQQSLGKLTANLVEDFRKMHDEIKEDINKK